MAWSEIHLGWASSSTCRAVHDNPVGHSLHPSHQGLLSAFAPSWQARQSGSHGLYAQTADYSQRHAQTLSALESKFSEMNHFPLDIKDRCWVLGLESWVLRPET